LGGKVKLEISGTRAVAAELPERALQALQNNPAVEFIEEDVKRFPLAQSTPYGVTMVQADQVWATGTTGANRKVCIIDSGFYMGHEDLQTSGVTGYPAGWNTDSCHHGSHVAGTIAALNNTTGVVGVLPNGVNLHIIKVFDGASCGWSYSSTLADAANRCVSAGSNVISMSLGGGTKSRTEETAFQNAYNSGVLSIAAAGNGGNSQMSYPASYPIVVSVGAVDSAKNIATFSQYNSQVEVSAPGVGVLSTVGVKEDNSLTVGGATYSGGYVEGAARTAGVTGALVDGGLCNSVGAWAGKVVLCQRGTISFVDKVNNVKAGGGIAAAIYNNVAGGFAGTLGTGVTSTISAIALSMEDGQAIIAAGGIGQSATQVSQKTEPASGYAYYDGTSMATPHVSAVAALIWSYKTSWTPGQIREALQKTAEDRGAVGRDNYYGFGIVRAKAALDYLKATYP
ncbi:MAG TPA: S8 family serine peptidase, partial [Archangium sp.]|nr:S8 family serine peptidase [Archangium sp.]